MCLVKKIVLFGTVLLILIQESSANNECWCFTGNSVNIRNAACGTVIGAGSVGNADCFQKRTGSTTCNLGGTTWTFKEFKYGSGSGWAAVDFLESRQCPSPKCKCFTTSSVNLRNEACGSLVVGSASDGDCFESTGRSQTCMLGSTTYTFVEFHYGDGLAWAAANYIEEKDCPELLDPNNDCLNCICSIESLDGGTTLGCGDLSDYTCEGMRGCVWDVNSCSCGPFQIKKAYFTDCTQFHSVSINDWHRCATDVNCARQCVNNYMARYGKHCTGKNLYSITCEEFGGLHNGGPGGCANTNTANYRTKVRNCCAGNNC